MSGHWDDTIGGYLDDKKRSTDLSWALLATNIKKFTKQKKGTRSPSHCLFSVLAFLSLKRCNLAAFNCN
ncbi:hypothetical protein [Wolbachia endosymbiont (group A) of Anomoia purmunda]|uniref:hypothetical protein n=1 Tax=Wolbachia endosymbiont (group A) of Anomoia purmunda TaxID=2953978 RepID=UPI00222E9EAD|nr:hypothetical protein [Wolbachia endosymbiont (group A) of Anomoia purmunda]